MASVSCLPPSAEPADGMTVVLVAFVVGLVVGSAGGWLVCLHHHKALRLDRDLHELDSHAHRDAAWQLSGEIEAIDVKRERWRDLAIKRLGGAS